ncbi:COG4 transport protein-domain-containing protein [Chlamydoabsidia padenii]|nr:COG4 transport protein-domain-containing protein [Chlamydoabsidia padenii]
MPSTTSAPISTNNETHLGNNDALLLSGHKIDTLTNLDDIRECLRLLDEEEARIDQSLDQSLSHKLELQNTLGTLDIMRPQLGNLRNDSTRMMETIYNTAKLATNISDKVRQLDKEQARTKQAIAYVEDVQELKHCVSGIQNAMQQKEYDEAAGLLQRASLIDPAILKGSLAEFTVPTSDNPDHPAKTLADAKATLFNIFSQRFDDAVAQRNQTNITRYFKLFPLIGCQTEGLDKYSRFVCNIVKARCAEELKLGTDASPLYFADSLTRLFENIATIIDQHQPLVESHYGRGKMLRVIQRLEEEADLQSDILLDQFLQVRKMDTKSLNIAMMRSNNTTNYRSTANGGLSPSTLASPKLTAKDRPASPSSPSAATNPLVDPRQLDANLLELSLISQRASLFQGFLHERANEEMEKLDDGKTDQVATPDGMKDRRFYGKNGLLASSGLAKRIKEVMNSFLVIDEYLLKRSMDKAMKMDNYDSSSQTSSCVDDVFYILKKVVKRSLSTYQPDIVMTTIQTVLKSVDTGYSQVLQQRLVHAFAANDTSSRSDRHMEQAKINYMVTLNNFDVSADYTQRLVEEMKQETQSAIWQNEENDIMVVETALDKLLSMSKNFNHLLQAAMEQLLGQMVKPRIRPLFQEAYREVKYVLEEDEYNEADLDELFVKRFRHGFDQLIASYRTALTDTNFSTLMGMVLDAVTLQWERIILQTRFNQYGSLRFDKDLRSVIQYLSNMTEWFARDKFTRLNQIATLLNFEEPSEIYHCWGAKAGPVSWRLTVTEVKKVLSLRLDFDIDEVTGLTL